MLNDDIWKLMDGGRHVGTIRESMMVAGRKTYSIFFHKGYIFSDAEFYDTDEWYMCDTSNPQAHIAQSSFTGLTFEPSRGRLPGDDWFGDDEII